MIRREIFFEDCKKRDVKASNLPLCPTSWVVNRTVLKDFSVTDGVRRQLYRIPRDFHSSGKPL